MTEIDEYAFVLFFRENRGKLDITQGYIRYSEIITEIKKCLVKVLNDFNATGLVDINVISEDIFVSLARNEAIIERKDKFAGLYYSYISDQYQQARQNILSASSINGFANEIGERFFADVFENYRQNELDDEQDSEAFVEKYVPAADRVVSLDHNQISSFEEISEDLITKLSKENSIDGDVDLRRRFLGQLKAGQELVRAQSVRAFLLYQTIFSVLIKLIEKYKDQAIAEAAKKLVDLLVERILK